MIKETLLFSFPYYSLLLLLTNHPSLYLDFIQAIRQSGKQFPATVPGNRLPDCQIPGGNKKILLIFLYHVKETLLFSFPYYSTSSPYKSFKSLPGFIQASRQSGKQSLATVPGNSLPVCQIPGIPEEIRRYSYVFPYIISFYSFTFKTF